jgi:4,5-dihydroxyphthalate decarboxylase
MSRPLIVLGVKEWDHLTPLMLGDVELESFRLELVRSAQIPDIHRQVELHGAETSFSQVLLGVGRGDRRLVPLPAFVRSAFRFRSIIVRKDSDLTELGQLRGRRVGMNAWPDTGNVWTKALVREAGVDIADVDWVLGPLTRKAGDDSRPRIGNMPTNVTPVQAAEDLHGLLLSGGIDAIITPVMPPAFHESTSPLRRLVPHYREAEEAYFRDKKFMPGIHLFVLRREIVDAFPTLASELIAALRESYRVWMEKRVTMVDTTPWQVDEIEALDRTLGLDWTPYDPPYAEMMTAEFCAELQHQGLTEQPINAADVFADYRSLQSS